jgi:hypothetical protein
LFYKGHCLFYKGSCLSYNPYFFIHFCQDSTRISISLICKQLVYIKIMPGLPCRGGFVAKQGIIQPCLPPQKTGTGVITKISHSLSFLCLETKKRNKRKFKAVKRLLQRLRLAEWRK